MMIYTYIDIYTYIHICMRSRKIIMYYEFMRKYEQIIIARAVAKIEIFKLTFSTILNGNIENKCIKIN